MRMRPALGVCGLLIAAGGAPAYADPALREAITDCRARIDPQVDVGYGRLATRCPELVGRLESGEWQHWLPRNWRVPGNDLSIRGLEELAVMIERERRREGTGPRPGTARLHAVLEHLTAAQPPPSGPWARLRQWLEAAVAEPDAERASWYERLFARAPPRQVAVELLTYGAVIAIVALALSIVVNELRAARRPQRRGVRRAPRERAAAVREPALTAADVERATLTERPGLLLRLVLDRLAALGRLPPAASLTVREAQTLAALSEASDREWLASLSGTAEEARYSGRQVPHARLSHALDAGRELLARLERRKAVRP